MPSDVHQLTVEENNWTLVLAFGADSGISEQIRIEVENTSGGVLSKGTPLAVTGVGAASQTIQVGSWNVETTTDPRAFIGFAADDIADTEVGYAITQGPVTGINTSGSAYSETWADGDIIYALIGAPGDLTNVRPSASGYVAVSTVTNAASGTSGNLIAYVPFTGANHSVLSADVSDASTGGNGAADSGKLLKFDSSGGITAAVTDATPAVTGSGGSLGIGVVGNGLTGLLASCGSGDTGLRIDQTQETGNVFEFLANIGNITLNSLGEWTFTSTTAQELTKKLRQEILDVTTTTSSPTSGISQTILVDDDTAAGDVTITLPAVASNDGTELKIKKLGTTGNVTVDGNSAETIDGSLTYTLYSQFSEVTIECDGTEWHVVSEVIKTYVETVISTSATLPATNCDVFADDDTAAGVITITLPAEADAVGYDFAIVKTGSTANVVIQDDAASTVATLTVADESVILKTNGTVWKVF